MIFVCAPPEDRWAALTVQILRQRGREVIVVPDGDFFAHVSVTWQLDPPHNQSLLTFEDTRISAASLSGVLASAMMAPAAASGVPGSDEQYVAVERHAFLIAWLNALPCRVINRPRPGMQLSLVPNPAMIQGIASCGFQLPPVLVTSSVTHALEFYDRTDQRALVTSPAGQGSYAVFGNEGRRDLIALVARYPVRLEAMPEGEALIVLTVGDRAFHVETPINWVPRTVQNDSTLVTTLSPEHAAQCCGLAQACGLEFAELHLVCAESGPVYCLAIAAWPTNDGTAGPLQREVAAALADRLVEGSRPLAEDVSRISGAQQRGEPQFVP